MQINDFEEFKAAFSIVLPYLSEIMGQDMAVNLSDKTHFLGFKDASAFHIPVTPGSVIPSGDPTLEAIKRGNQLIDNVPADVYGTPLKAVMTPLISDGEVIGCIGIARNMDNEVKVLELASHLEESLYQVSAAIQQIASSAGSINENQQHLGTAVGQIDEAVNKINGVLELIKNIADQTKMLGLNAAIEAARAGEAGRGFGVVAEEIRKLSDESRQTVSQIRDFAEQIREKVERAQKVSQTTLKASEEQAAATQQITASIEEISSSSHVLGDIAKVL